ncbi:uncharacterized protein BHQ10_005346 [Talaromyces amestolkiae]|uniref:EthD domain-containing protein n=1 Tax=Talaromyces amestolkiae TaxID=1196081 RepID=A0A364L0M6_TALAM|nr:uncharacterized protein BHQ10_005346 [Talaromyces amestolkiae]RAO69334.1 hypothetical protein BHQ10_005346 [Talaromyces amestolkiae]
MGKVGYLRVQLDAREGADIEAFQKWRVDAFANIPGATSKLILTATDAPEEGKPYRSENAYDLSDVDAVNLQHLAAAWKKTSAPMVSSMDLLLYERLNFSSHQNIVALPPKDTVVVANSLTPENDPAVIQDYHDWYEQEHIHKLMAIPGYRLGGRYKLIGCVGSNLEYTGPFLAVHQYDKENGLGGTEWTKSIKSDWTMKIDQRMVKRPHRRVFQVDDAYVLT